MAKILKLFRYLPLLFLFISVCSSARSLDQSNCTISCAESFNGVRESTGKNDGPEVKMFLKSVGLGEGYSWCSAFVHYVLTQCGVKNSINAWSPSAHNSKNVVYGSGRHYKQVNPGDVFTIYSASKKRIAHTGFVYAQQNERFYQTIEGNTNDGGSANGDGVYKRRRSFNQTYSITRWTYD